MYRTRTKKMPGFIYLILGTGWFPLSYMTEMSNSQCVRLGSTSSRNSSISNGHFLTVSGFNRQNQTETIDSCSFKRVPSAII